MADQNKMIAVDKNYLLTTISGSSYLICHFLSLFFMVLFFHFLSNVIIEVNMFNNDIGVIIWKKTDKYRCIINNCNIKKNAKLSSYIKNITYEDAYQKIISGNEDQMVGGTSKNCNDGKIILKYIPDDIILEIRIPANINIQLLSSLSHKIRNPLANIFGILSLFDKNKLGKAEREYIYLLKKSCYDIITTMNDIIDIVNFNCGDLKLVPEIINLNDLMNECHDILIDDIEEKKLVLKISIGDDVPKYILTDKAKLKQIIVNMLINSIQHTNIGGIIITVTLFKEGPSDCPFEYKLAEKPKYNIKFTIKDTGSGMDAHKKAMVENILGINKNVVNNYNYTGLGLIICKYICNLMGGNIWLKTDVDVGTVFNFNVLVNSG